MFVALKFMRICYFVYLFGFDTIFVDVFGVNVDEARFRADSLCFFRFLGQHGSGRLIDLGDDSAVVHVFIGSASFVSIHLFIQNPIYRLDYFIINPPLKIISHNSFSPQKGSFNQKNN